MEGKTLAKPLLSHRCRGGLTLILVTAAIRLVFLASLPLDLSPDESYYWHWSLRPDWGYYSKPPLVAWIHAALSFGPQATWWVRFPAWLFGVATHGLLYTLACRLFGQRTGFQAALAFALLPCAVALNLIMTIDAPLLFFWTAGLLAYWQGQRQPQAWIPLALVVFLGVLAKQMMLVFPLLMILCASSAFGWRLFRPWRPSCLCSGGI
jgi:4-amino-4-deoxy-L-arabinose transferase-like glycosyltransferase